MYDFEDLKKAFSDPFLLLREINRLYHSRIGLRDYNPRGIDIFEQDWDNLVILDACRYDVFAEYADVSGRLEKRTSRGAATPEFVKANFAGKRLDDTVYVTGNDWFLQLREEIDARVHDIYTPDGSDPAEMTETVLDVADQYPNKRLVAHYIPPHHPFVGQTASEYFPNFEAQLDKLFERIRRDELNISDELLRRAYVENLSRVLPEVERLLDTLDGRTVVTADHGELLGDRTYPLPIKDYGHHMSLYVDTLVDVPWLVHEAGVRREIVSEEMDERRIVDHERVEERLKRLGYKV